MDIEDKIKSLSAFLLKERLYDEYNYLRKVASEQPSDNDIVAATLVKEASVDRENGMTAVHQVIMNRAANTGMSAKEVVLEKDSSGVSQFSCWNNVDDIKSSVDAERGVVSYIDDDGKEVSNFNVALLIVSEEKGNEAVKEATHYYTGEAPSWAVAPSDCFYNNGGKMNTKNKSPTNDFPESTKAKDGSNILGYCEQGNPCWKLIGEVGSHIFGIDYSNSKYLPKGTEQCYKDSHDGRGYGIWRWPRYRDED